MLPRSLFLFVLLLLSACGAKVVVDEDDLANEPDASVEVDAGPVAPPQCLCPDAPGYAPCEKPMECCPVVGQCKDPASFNCTGSTMTCPP